MRMQAAEVQPKRPPQILASDREVTRLGASVFRGGRVSAEAIDFVCGVLRRFAAAYGELDILGVRAVATSAIRDASNQHEFVQRASEALGTPVEIISGLEEARLIHAGVQSRWPHPKQRILIVDVGGGSAEIIAAEDGEMTDAVSKPLGAVRLTEVFLKNDPPDEQDLHRLEKFIEERLDVAIRKIGRHRFDRAIATSATASAIVCAINEIPRAKRDEADRIRAAAPAVSKLYRDLGQMPLGARKKVAGIGPRRAEIIVPGAAVLAKVLDVFKLPSLYYSAAGVRDGIIADLAARGVGRELSRLSREQLRTVETMSKRYGVSVKHGQRVAHLAHTLFEAMLPLHKLPRSHGRLLEASAYLHDAGHYVSDTGHHKHSAYLVQNSDMPGFTDQERLLIAMLCRYHRKSLPSVRHESFQKLSSDDKRALTMMIPLLRLADGFDTAHEGNVNDLSCEIRNGSVVLNYRGSGDTSLEAWAAERAADIFRQVYDLPMVVVKSKRGAP